MITWVCFKVLSSELWATKEKPQLLWCSLGVTFGTFCTQTTPPISDVTAGVCKQGRKCCGQVTEFTQYKSCDTPLSDTCLQGALLHGWCFSCHSVFQTSQKMFYLKIPAEKEKKKMLHIGCLTFVAGSCWTKILIIFYLSQSVSLNIYNLVFHVNKRT